MYREWTLLLVGPEHGLVSPLGDDHASSPAHYERVDVCESSVVTHLQARDYAHEKIMRKLEISLQFYKSRCELLQHQQSRMRDPERTIVCDILANGELLPDPDGSRYGVEHPAAAPYPISADYQPIVNDAPRAGGISVSYPPHIETVTGRTVR